MSPMPEPKRDPEALGPCGCVDYHMADCPIKTASFTSSYDDFYDDIDWN